MTRPAPGPRPPTDVGASRLPWRQPHAATAANRARPPKAREELIIATDSLIAGEVAVSELLADLARRRPVFHSEADFQHAFARALWQANDQIEVRLEARQPGLTREYLDLLAYGPQGRTAIEFKYFTRHWSDTTGEPGELYDLKAHAATDLARRNFIFDIERLERFGATPDQNGLAIMLTNDTSLWSEPPKRPTPTRDQDFRIHEGRTLAGTLLWGGGDYAANTRHLAGHYECRWKLYSNVASPNGTFRYLLIETTRADETRDNRKGETGAVPIRLEDL